MFELIDVLAQNDPVEQESDVTVTGTLLVDFDSEETVVLPSSIAAVSQNSETSPTITSSSSSQNLPSSVPKNTKIVLPRFLLHVDPSKQPPCGTKIVMLILKMVERDGYENCLTFKKRGNSSRTSMSNYMLLMVVFLRIKRLVIHHL